MILNVTGYCERLQQAFVNYDPLVVSNAFLIKDAGILIRMYRENGLLFHSLYVPHGMKAIVISAIGGAYIARAFDDVITTNAPHDKRLRVLVNSIWIVTQESQLMQQLLSTAA